MLASAQDILSRAAGPLLSAEPTNPAGYRLTRLAAWLTVGMPPHDEDFKTRIPGPDKMIKVSLEQLAASGKHLQAVQACEGRVTEFLFWLDITRLTATSLQALGSDFAAALLAVETETRYFLKRLPGIEQLAFSDATPFADQETRGWLSRLAISQEQPPCPSGAEQDAKGEAGDSDMSKKVEEARNLAATGQTVKAVTMLQDRIAKAGSGRSRLLWRIILVELLTAVGRPEIAASIMSQIINDVDTFRVEEFDPELALRGLRSALSALAASRAPESAAQAAQILARVTRLNPAEGLRLSGVKEGFGKL
jgi:type VI secretion system protein VasJ